MKKKNKDKIISIAMASTVLASNTPVNAGFFDWLFENENEESKSKEADLNKLELIGTPSEKTESIEYDANVYELVDSSNFEARFSEIVDDSVVIAGHKWITEGGERIETKGRLYKINNVTQDVELMSEITYDKVKEALNIVDSIEIQKKEVEIDSFIRLKDGGYLMTTSIKGYYTEENGLRRARNIALVKINESFDIEYAKLIDQIKYGNGHTIQNPTQKLTQLVQLDTGDILFIYDGEYIQKYSVNGKYISGHSLRDYSSKGIIRNLPGKNEYLVLTEDYESGKGYNWEIHKYNYDGTFLKEYNFTSIGQNINLKEVLITSDNKIVVSGSVTKDTSNYTYNGFVAKFDLDFNLEWHKTIDFSKDGLSDKRQFTDIVECPNGNYLVYGFDPYLAMYEFTKEGSIICYNESSSVIENNSDYVPIHILNNGNILLISNETQVCAKLSYIDIERRSYNNSISLDKKIIGDETTQKWLDEILYLEDGGYLVCGKFKDGETKLMSVRYDSQFNTLWTNSLLFKEDSRMSNGNVLMYEVDSENNQFTIHSIALTNGVSENAKVIDGELVDYRVLPNGNILLLSLVKDVHGYTMNDDYTVHMLDNEFKSLKEIDIDTSKLLMKFPTSIVSGGINNFAFNKITQDDDGNLYFGGNCYAAYDEEGMDRNPPKMSHAILFKMSSDGNYEWINRVLSGGEKKDIFRFGIRDMQVLSNGDILAITKGKSGIVRISKDKDEETGGVIWKLDSSNSKYITDYLDIDEISKIDDSNYIITGANQSHILKVNVDKGEIDYFSNEEFYVTDIEINNDKVNILSVNKAPLYKQSSLYTVEFGNSSPNINLLNQRNDYISLVKGEEFNPLDYIEITDKEDGVIDLSKVSIVFDNVDSQNAGSYYVIYSVSDDNGNVTERKVDVKVSSSQNLIPINHIPTIEANDVDISYGSDFNARDYVTANDKEEGDISDRIVIEGDVVDTSKPGTYKVIYKVSDLQGATATKEITVTVTLPPLTSINNAPIIEADDIEILYGSYFEAKDYVKATDNEEGDITDRVVVKGDTVDTSKPGTYKVIYEVSDLLGSTTAKEITVTVKLPLATINNAPKITANDIEILYGSDFEPLDYVEAYDEEDGNIIGRVVVSGDTVDTSRIGTYKVIYTVSDLQGATATKEILVTVKLPLVVMNEAPKIEVEDNIRVMLNDRDFDPLNYVKAYDKEDGDITHKVIAKEDNVDTSIPGIYKVLYEVKDSGGIKAIKEVEVRVIMPSVAINAAPIINAKNIQIFTGSKFNAKDYVSAIDEEDGDLTDNIIVRLNEVNTSKAGTYRVVYEVMDSGGIKTTKEIEVKVVQLMASMNSTPTLNASDIEMFEGNKIDLRKGVSAIDPEDGDLTDKIVIEGVSDTSSLARGVYPITYKVVDSGGITTRKTVNLTVYGDVDIPKISIKSGKDIITITQGSKFNITDFVKAIDSVDGDITDKIVVTSNNIKTDKIGISVVECTVTNSRGLTRKASFFVSVEQSKVQNDTTNNGTINNSGNTINGNGSSVGSNGGTNTNSNTGNGISKPQTGDNMMLYGLTSIVSLLSIKILNRKKDDEK